MDAGLLNSAGGSLRYVYNAFYIWFWFDGVLIVAEASR
jgi:hypothetical protein